MSNDQEDQDQLGDAWETALAEQNGGAGEGPDDVSAAELEALQAEPGNAGAREGGEEVNLDVILDIPVTLSMEIGRTRLSIRNLLQLNQGSVVELDRLAGEPLDVMVNGTLVAHGEVVVVNERFGIRLTDVISPSERIRKLK
jgi:flagellar motor switch protein FliN/FliY